MWNRKDIKAKGKASFKANFWKCVAAALILAFIGGGAGSAASSGTSYSSMNNIMNNRSAYEDSMDELDDEMDELDDEIDAINDEAGDEDRGMTFVISSESGEDNVITFDDSESMAVFAVIFVIVFIVALAAMAIGFVIDAFIFNPIELGCKRFFRRNLDEPAALSNLTFGFDNHYKNNVKTMFLRDLYTALWSLLFIIPGIVKSYEYRMIPYIISENPEMSTEEVFAESKRLMDGNKWKTFVLDLSFILWDLASMATCGLVGIFYSEPYKRSTDAALYEALKYGTGTAEAK